MICVMFKSMHDMYLQHPIHTKYLLKFSIGRLARASAMFYIIHYTLLIFIMQVVPAFEQKFR